MTPAEFEQEARFAMAAGLFERQRLSLEQAAALAAIDQPAFLLRLADLRSATVKLLPGGQKESRAEKPPPSAPDPNSTPKRQQTDNNGVEAQEDFLLVDLHALTNGLGAVGMVRFVQRLSPGRGNYSIERDIILENPTVDNLVDELERRRRDP
jgi:hypothetical protein